MIRPRLYGQTRPAGRSLCIVARFAQKVNRNALLYVIAGCETSSGGPGSKTPYSFDTDWGAISFVMGHDLQVTIKPRLRAAMRDKQPDRQRHA